MTDLKRLTGGRPRCALAHNRGVTGITASMVEEFVQWVWRNNRRAVAMRVAAIPNRRTQSWPTSLPIPVPKMNSASKHVRPTASIPRRTKRDSRRQPSCMWNRKAALIVAPAFRCARPIRFSSWMKFRPTSRNSSRRTPRITDRTKVYL